VKYTIAPAYKLTDHLSVRAEVSYQDYSDYVYDSALFFGIQSYFTF